MTDPRPVYIIARDIRADWKRPYFGAVPYLDAMRDITTVNDTYGYDSARSIINYFLANAATWRGPVARTIKAELKRMLSDTAKQPR